MGGAAVLNRVVQGGLTEGGDIEAEIEGMREPAL